MPSAPADRPAPRARRPLPSVSVVIPVRDSAGLPPMLRSLVWGVRPVADEVIVVSAGPGDDAAVLAACPEALLVRPTRPGVGNALACGFAAASGDLVVALDGDGATDPGELPHYVEALVAGADVALGSRYRPGGRDLTGGRFRRRLDLLLSWLVNVLYRAHRTDPGFGYTAIWRDAIDRLGLPDPSPAAPAAWGDGPEIQALITVRTAARGLAVTEVPGVAYPRMRRAARADRTTLRHWLRALATEFRGRTTRPGRHAVPPTARPATAARFATSPSSSARPASPRSAPPPPGLSTAPMAPPAPLRPTPARATGDRPEATEDRPDTRATPRRDAIWGPAQRGRQPTGLRLADIWGPLDRMIGHAQPTTTPAGEELSPRYPAADQGPDAEPRREVGTKRRHLEAYRQRPDLRPVEPDGATPTRTRSGRLRPIPQE